jgi:RimJ/RimL family protein N-acetyltransferase
MTGTIETERLILTPPAVALAGSLVRLLDNLNVSAMLARVPHPYGSAEAVAYLLRVTSADPGETVFALHRKAGGGFLGLCSFTHGDTPEFGYWLGEPFWGRGYMSEAARAVVNYAFRAAAVPQLSAGCRIENAASRRILERLGFELTGDTLMQSVALGRDVPSHRFILCREGWERLQ